MELHRTVDLNYIESEGRGAPMLLLHGLNESLEGYRPALSHLNRHLHVYAVDFRGHGGSARSKPYRVQDYGSDVIKFIQTRIGERVILAGHSLGGLVAAYVASLRPDLVHALILEEPPLYTAQSPTLRETPFYPLFIQVRRLLQEHQTAGGTAHDMEELVRRWPTGSGENNSATMMEVFGSDYVSRLALELHRTDPQTLDPVLDGTLFDGFDPDESLRRIACPTRVITGAYAQGGAVRPQDLEKIISLIPTCSRVVWEELGHDIHTVRPMEYSQEVLRFVEAIRPPA